MYNALDIIRQTLIDKLYDEKLLKIVSDQKTRQARCYNFMFKLKKVDMSVTAISISYFLVPNKQGGTFITHGPVIVEGSN